jgi:hypothetical protein
MIRVFGYKDVGQQTRMGDASFNRQAGHRRLRDVTATATDHLAPDRADHLERCRDASELLGYILAKRAHWHTAVGATRFGIERVILAWDMRGKRFLWRVLCGWYARCRCACPSDVSDAACGRQILKLLLESLDLPIQLLGFTAELHALELVDQHLKPFDLEIALGERRASLDQHGLERCNIIGKIGAGRHATQFTSLRRGLQHRQCGATAGLAPIDALKQHRQLGGAQEDLAAISLRPDEAAAFEPLGEQPQPVVSRPQNLDEVATAAAEDEDIAAQGILFERRLHLCCQALEAAAHISHARRNPDACTNGAGQSSQAVVQNLFGALERQASDAHAPLTDFDLDFAARRR